jgi:hypothetical protein
MSAILTPLKPQMVADRVRLGLAFAGVTGFCGLARLLSTMPWNRAAGA